MKKFIPILLIVSFLFFLTGCNDKQKKQDNNSYNTTRTSTSEETNNNENSQNEVDNNESSKKPVETEISSFSTKIYTPNDEARQNNIRITCSKLNGVVVNPRRNIFFLQYSWKSNS